ncbi:hypothetical protein [Streptomyces flavofungini]
MDTDQTAGCQNLGYEDDGQAHASQSHAQYQDDDDDDGLTAA